MADLAGADSPPKARLAPVFLCAGLVASNLVVPWADGIAEHCDNASDILYAHIHRKQTSGPGVVRSALAAAMSARPAALLEGADRAAAEGVGSAGPRVPTGVHPQELAWWDGFQGDPFGDMTVLTDGMNELVSLVNKVEAFFIKYGALLWKMMLLAVIFYLSGSPRLVVLTWVSLNLLGGNLTVSLAGLSFYVMSFIVAEGPVATVIIGVLWLLHEVGILDFQKLAVWLAETFGRELDLDGDGKFDIDDVRRFLQRPLFSAAMLPTILGLLLISSSFAPNVKNNGNARRDMVIGGYCLTAGMMFLVMSCIYRENHASTAGQTADQRKKSNRMKVLSAIVPGLIGMYLIGTYLDSSSLVLGADHPPANSTSPLIPGLPVPDSPMVALVLGCCFIAHAVIFLLIHSMHVRGYFETKHHHKKSEATAGAEAAPEPAKKGWFS